MPFEKKENLNEFIDTFSKMFSGYEIHYNNEAGKRLRTPEINYELAGVDTKKMAENIAKSVIAFGAKKTKEVLNSAPMHFANKDLDVASMNRVMINNPQFTAPTEQYADEISKKDFDKSLAQNIEPLPTKKELLTAALAIELSDRETSYDMNGEEIEGEKKYPFVDAAKTAQNMVSYMERKGIENTVEVLENSPGFFGKIKPVKDISTMFTFDKEKREAKGIALAVKSLKNNPKLRVTITNKLQDINRVSTANVIANKMQKSR
jgi:hypothetical protein